MPGLMKKQINKTERELKMLKIYVFLFTIAVIVLFSFNNSTIADDVIRVKGIIIEDENGNERILIGAPTPFANNRVRTDTSRVKKSWGYIHPNYLDFYKNYDNNNFGMLILDENGYDRIAIGSTTPDPNIGKRMAPSSGIIINDENGFERSGYGILKIDGVNTVNLGLDTDKGTEGLLLQVSDDGTSGLFMKHNQGSIILGKADSENWLTKDGIPLNGLIIEDSVKTIYNLNTMKVNQ